MKKIIFLCVLFNGFIEGMSDKFIKFDYLDPQTNLHSHYISMNNAFQKLMNSDLVTAFRVYAYSEIQNYCSSSIKTGCFPPIIDIGPVVQKQFLSQLKKSYYNIPKDIILIINSTIFKVLGNLKNVNMYLNAFENTYLHEDKKSDVLAYLIQNLDHGPIEQTEVIDDNANLITILLSNMAFNYRIIDKEFQDIILLLQKHKYDDFATFMFAKQIKNINDEKDDNNKANRIDDYILQASELDENSDFYQKLIKHLKSEKLDQWITEIDNKRKNRIVYTPKEEKEEELKPDDIKTIPKPGKRKPKKGKTIKKPVDVIIPKDERKDTPLVIVPTKSAKEYEQEEIKRFVEVDFNQGDADISLQIIDSMLCNCLSEEKANLMVLLYNTKKELSGSKDKIPYFSSDETTVVNNIKKDYNIDLPTIVKNGMSKINKQPDDLNLYLNAIIKDYDSGLSHTTDVPDDTIQKIPQASNFPLITQRAQKRKLPPALPPKNPPVTPPLTANTNISISTSDSLKPLADALFELAR